MTFDPDEKLLELFRKHMSIPSTLTDGSVLSDEEVSDSLYHNLEYCKWRILRNETVEIGSDWSYKGQFHPIGILYGQNDAMRKVESDFINYLTTTRAHALARIADAIQRMQSMKVTPASIQVPKIWNRLVPQPVFGLPCTIGAKPRIFSEAKYGRFVEFTF